MGELACDILSSEFLSLGKPVSLLKWHSNLFDNQLGSWRKSVRKVERRRDFWSSNLLSVWGMLSSYKTVYYSTSANNA